MTNKEFKKKFGVDLSKFSDLEKLGLLFGSLIYVNSFLAALSNSVKGKNKK